MNLFANGLLKLWFNHTQRLKSCFILATQINVPYMKTTKTKNWSFKKIPRGHVPCVGGFFIFRDLFYNKHLTK
jgi:hypothetical protein